MKEKEITILAIESSCDETAAAVVREEEKSSPMSFHHRLNYINYMEGLFRRLPPESILRRSIR